MCKLFSLFLMLWPNSNLMFNLEVMIMIELVNNDAKFKFKISWMRMKRMFLLIYEGYYMIWNNIVNGLYLILAYVELKS